MKLLTLKQLWFWSRNAWHNFTTKLARKTRQARANLSRRDYTKFQITQDSHPRKVQRWLNRGGFAPTDEYIRIHAYRHIHPRKDREPITVLT